MSTIQQEFEKALKQSHHFADALNTHRRATAAVIAAMIATLDQQEKDAVMATLRKLDESTGSISDDTSRRLLCRLIVDALKGQ